MQSTVPATRIVHVDVDVTFFMRRPNTHFKGGDRSKPLKSGMPVAHTSSPDVDNLVKFIVDVLEGVAFTNDKQVARVTATKVYDSLESCGGRAFVKVSLFDSELV